LAGDAEIVFEASKQNFFQVLNQLKLKLRGEKCCYLTGLPKALFCCGLALPSRAKNGLLQNTKLLFFFSSSTFKTQN